MYGLDRIIREHPFFAGLEPRFVDSVCGCAKNVRFEAGSMLFRESEPADEFYLLREGRVALQIAAPGRGSLTIQTLGPGELVGISWLIPPYRWRTDAHALERVHAIGIDGACLRDKLDADPQLSCQVLRRVLSTVISRLHDTRLQALDVYGNGV